MEYFAIIAVMGLLILAHEAGHLWAASACRIPVEQFSLGFGPRVWGIRRQGTEYRVGVIPVGGYVVPRIPSDAEWLKVPVARRVAFSLGGPAANTVLTLLLLAAAGCSESGPSWETIVAIPFAQIRHLVAQIWATLPEAAKNPDQLSGVIGITAIGGRQVGLDLPAILRFAAFLSVNLAIINLVPVPPLDGGSIVMSVLQRVYRPLGRLRLPLALAGWGALGLLFLYTTVMDVYRLV